MREITVRVSSRGVIEFSYNKDSSGESTIKGAWPVFFYPANRAKSGISVT